MADTIVADEEEKFTLASNSVKRELISAESGTHVEKMEIIVKANGLSKTYREIGETVRNISFAIEKNSIMGILGPSGAGKSTVFKILTLMLRRTSGIVKLLGFNMSDDKIYE
jgi:ABC-type uncharacterized transport system ATPase subunit